MKIPKVGKQLTIMLIILLSVLVTAWIGGFFHTNKQSAEEEDRLQKGFRLFQEQKFEEAYGSFRVAWLLATTIDDNPKRALKALKGMGDCAFWIGAVDSCIYNYEQAVILARELNKPYDEYEIYSQLKQAYVTKVDMQSVLRIEQKIDSLTSGATDMRIRIGLQQRLAQEAIQAQNPKLAEYYLQANESLLDSLLSDERQSMQFLVYGHLRDFYFGIQDFVKARKYSLLYIGTSKEFFKQQQMGYMAYDMEALICAHQKDRKGAFEALDSMKYGLTLPVGASKENVMHYYDIKGRVHTMFEEWELACDEYKKALAAVEGTNAEYRIDYFRIVQLLGGALFQTKRNDEARGCYAEVARYCEFQFGKESLAYADALWTLANFEGFCGNVNEGKQYCINSIDICKQLVADQLKYISVQERNAFWNNFAPKMWGMTAYALKVGDQQNLFTEKCYEALLFSKSLLLESDRTMAVAISNECSPQEQRIYNEMQGLQNQLKELMNNYEKNKYLIDKLHQKISQQNQRLTPIISKLGYTSFLNQNYTDIKQSLQDGEVLLDFMDYKSDEEVQQFATYVIEKNQSHPKLVKLFTEEDVKKLLAGKPVDFLYKEPYASNAINLIWKPLSKVVKEKSTIYYVPSGILHRIAFESLPLNDGSLLGDHYRFVRLTSAREIAKLRGESQLARNATATLYGALKYDMDTTSMSHEASRYKLEPILAFNRGEIIRGNRRFKELPNTKEEIEIIERILRGKKLKVTTQTGIEGTEESFLSLSGKAPEILHIATHGFYYTPEKAKTINYLNGYNDVMLLSGLVMAGGNRAWMGLQVPEGVLGGVLTANNIASLNLRGTDMLVLSACQTGLGVATPEGLFGLQRAFKKAGVQTIIMSLWNVDDEATKDFMVKFYEELADCQNKWDKRNAFEKAKAFVRSKTYIRGGKPYKGDPYYWAGFVMLD